MIITFLALVTGDGPIWFYELGSFYSARKCLVQGGNAPSDFCQCLNLVMIEVRWGGGVGMGGGGGLSGPGGDFAWWSMLGDGGGGALLYHTLSLISSKKKKIMLKRWGLLWKKTKTLNISLRIHHFDLHFRGEGGTSFPLPVSICIKHYFCVEHWEFVCVFGGGGTCPQAPCSYPPGTGESIHLLDGGGGGGARVRKISNFSARSARKVAI